VITKKHTSRGINTLKGFLSGSLIIGSVINPYSIIIQLIMFLVGVAVLMHALLLYGKNIHPATTVSMAIIGGVLSILFTFIGYAHFYMALIFFVTILLYIYISMVRKVS
jgi:hypothetical protein